MSNEKKDLQEAYHEKMGIPRVTLHEALWQIKTSIQQNQQRGVWCLISEAGEGKSQSVNRLLKEMDHHVVDIRTAQLTHVGAGVPQKAVDGFFDYAVPSDWPKKDGKKYAMLFDEVNQGQPFAIALVFKLLEDRGLYGYKLPDDCPVILLMNPGTAAYNVSKIETNPAINRRVKKLYIHTPFAEWRLHAETEQFHSGKDFPDGKARPCHPKVVNYLTAQPNLIYAQLERDGGKQFACPATWQTVSHDLYTLEAVGESLTSKRAHTRIAASINVVQADGLIQYIKDNEILIGPGEVLEKYKKDSKLRKRILELQKEPGGQYLSLTQKVADEIFHTRPPVNDIVNQLALFWADMPIEIRAPYFNQLKASATTTDNKRNEDNISYMKELTTVMNKSPYWDKITSTANETEKAGREELEAGSSAVKALKQSGAAKR